MRESFKKKKNIEEKSKEEGKKKKKKKKKLEQEKKKQQNGTILSPYPTKEITNLNGVQEQENYLYEHGANVYQAHLRVFHSSFSKCRISVLLVC